MSIKKYTVWLNETLKENVSDKFTCAFCGSHKKYLTKERGQHFFRCEDCGKSENDTPNSSKEKSTGFSPGYSNSDYTDGLPKLEKKTPTNFQEWIDWFETRCEQLRKKHNRSYYVNSLPGDQLYKHNIIEKVRSLLTGEIEALPYTEMSTSTAGFQWGKEFLDILAHDGLLRVVKKGNRVFAELGVDDKIKQELYRKFRGSILGKKYGL